MDWWQIAKIVWGGIGLGVIGLIVVVAWRARGVVSWNRAIRKDLSVLAAEAGKAAPARKAGIRLVIAECDHILRAFEPPTDAGPKRLRTLVRSVAACFFPEAERPELQISLGHLIKSLDASLYRFDRIIHRPGLSRIATLNIRTVNGLYRWSTDLLKRPWIKWYMAHHQAIERFGLIRLFIIPDPLSWVLFLSRKIMVLVLMKNLLVDLTLFVGRLALDAYDGQPGRSEEAPPASLEAVLEDLSRAEMAPAEENDAEIAAIRHKLVGLSSIVLSDPTWQDLKTAVRQAAEIFARRHFPDAERPLEEAAIGPLLVRTRSWLGTLGKGHQIMLVRSVYRLRLETLFQAKDLSDLVLTPAVRGIVRNSLAAYGWLKWPLKIYRRLKRFSLPGIAADVGWVLGRKSALILLYGRAFDQACRELEWVYRASAESESKTGQASVPRDIEATRE